MVVVDNASEPETIRVLNAWSAADPLHRVAIRCVVNVGGAGGFAKGVRKAMEKSSTRWLWLMDDDAFVPEQALEHLMAAVDGEDCCYASVAVGAGEGEQNDLVWHATESPDGSRVRTNIRELEKVAEVRSVPFLGFLVSRCMVERIGPPDDSFFVCADDVEYSARIRQNGGRVLLVRNSVIYHPMPKRRQIPIFGRRIDFRYQPVRKSYYEVRNKIRVAQRYWPSALWSKTIPGLVFRLGLSLVLETERRARFGAFVLGFWDGLRDVGGRREGF